MSSPEERLGAIRDIYFDAMENEPSDLAEAKTAAIVTQILANVATARSVYYEAISSELAAVGNGVEDAMASAKAALESVKIARARSSKIADLLGSLNGATDAVASLLKQANAKL